MRRRTRTDSTSRIELLPRRVDTPEHSFTDDDLLYLEGFPRFREKIKQARKRRPICTKLSMFLAYRRHTGKHKVGFFPTICRSFCRDMALLCPFWL